MRRGSTVDQMFAQSPRRGVRSSAGFALLEVLIALTVLAVGAALTLSVISGSLGNIRKVRLRTNMVQHAETVMELALLDESVKGPTTLAGDFEDGTRWSVIVSDFEMPVQQPLPDALQRPLPIKLLSYAVEITGPGSTAPDFRLYTLKLVPAQVLGMQAP
jgi:prepilin-type N-terminal cleavage/methylation domain-containing protein